MAAVFYFGVFLFGLAAGSFINVCIYRLPLGVSLVHPGSFCPLCRTPVRWFDNIPVFSFLILAGKCRSCGKRISLRYPAVELLTGLLLLLVVFDCIQDGRTVFVTGTYIYLLLGLITLSFIDIAHEIIPDEISLMGIPVALVLSVLIPELHYNVPFFSPLIEQAPQRVNAACSSLAGIAVGGGTLWIIGAAAKLILKKEAMGFGDVKLMAMVGGLTGWLNTLLAFFLACALGSLVGIIVMIKTKNRRIPFGPFLAAGTLITILYSTELIYFFTHIYPVWIRKLMGME